MRFMLAAAIAGFLASAAHADTTGSTTPQQHPVSHGVAAKGTVTKILRPQVHVYDAKGQPTQPLHGTHHTGKTSPAQSPAQNPSQDSR